MSWIFLLVNCVSTHIYYFFFISIIIYLVLVLVMFYFYLNNKNLSTFVYYFVAETADTLSVKVEYCSVDYVNSDFSKSAINLVKSSNKFDNFDSNISSVNIPTVTNQPIIDDSKNLALQKLIISKNVNEQFKESLFLLKEENKYQSAIENIETLNQFLKYHDFEIKDNNSKSNYDNLYPTYIYDHSLSKSQNMIQKFQWLALDQAHNVRAKSCIGAARHFWNVWEETFQFSIRTQSYWSGEKYCITTLADRFNGVNLASLWYDNYKKMYPLGYPDTLDPKFDLIEDLRIQIKRLTVSSKGSLLGKYYTLEEASVVDSWSRAHVKRFIMENMIPHLIMDPEEYKRFLDLECNSIENENEPVHPLGERTGRARLKYIEFEENPSVTWSIPTYKDECLD